MSCARTLGLSDHTLSRIAMSGNEHGDAAIVHRDAEIVIEEEYDNMSEVAEIAPSGESIPVTQVHDEAPSAHLDQSSTQSELTKFIELQNMMFENIMTRLPTATSPVLLKLPPFDPNKPLTSPRLWISTADYVMQHRNLSTSDLIITLTEAFRGPASEWLAQILDPLTLTWDTFKTNFVNRFCLTETSTATLLQAMSKPQREHDLNKILTDVLTKVRSAFRHKTVEELIIMVSAAIMTQHEPGLRKFLYTHDSFTETELIKKIKALTAAKPPRPEQPPTTRPVTTPNSSSSFKRPYQETKPGGPPAKSSKPSTQSGPWPGNASVSDTRTTTAGAGQGTSGASTPKRWCRNCRVPSHWTSDCRSSTAKNAVSSGKTPTTNTVNICDVNPIGTAEHQGNSYQYVFDSGSECSLIRQNLQHSFSGFRIHNPVRIRGIGQGEIITSDQISTVLMIDNIEIPVSLIYCP